MHICNHCRCNYSETCLSGHLNKAVIFLLQPRAGGPKLSQKQTHSTLSCNPATCLMRIAASSFSPHVCLHSFYITRNPVTPFNAYLASVIKLMSHEKMWPTNWLFEVLLLGNLLLV